MSFTAGYVGQVLHGKRRRDDCVLVFDHCSTWSTLDGTRGFPLLSGTRCHSNGLSRRDCQRIVCDSDMGARFQAARSRGIGGRVLAQERQPDIRARGTRDPGQISHRIRYLCASRWSLCYQAKRAAAPSCQTRRLTIGRLRRQLAGQRHSVDRPSVLNRGT